MKIKPLFVIAAESTQESPSEVATEQHRQRHVGIEEIIVTAQKRAENIQDVPISIQAHRQDQESLGLRQPDLGTPVGQREAPRQSPEVGLPSTVIPQRPPAMRKGGFSRVTSASWTRRDTFTWPGGRKS